MFLGALYRVNITLTQKQISLLDGRIDRDLMKLVRKTQDIMGDRIRLRRDRKNVSENSKRVKRLKTCHRKRDSGWGGYDEGK